MARGYNVDSVDGDEALTLDKTKFENEALAANRGNLRFKGNALHHGIDLSSSMPTNQKGKWVLDFANYYEEDGYKIDQIIDGETIAEVLEYVQYNPKKMVRTVESWVTSSVKSGIITVEEGREFLSNYRSGLYGYTYLE